MNNRIKQPGQNEENDLNERTFINPKVLVSDIYSDSESEPESDECDDPSLSPGRGDDSFVEERELDRSSDKDSGSDISENEISTAKKLRLSRSPKKTSCTPKSRPSTSHPVRLISASTSLKKKTPVSCKAKSKSTGHTPARPLTEIHPKKLRDVNDSDSGAVDDLGKISHLLSQVLQRLERTEAKLDSVEHKLESSSSLSSSSSSEKKRKVPQIVKVIFVVKLLIKLQMVLFRQKQGEHTKL